MTKVVNREGRVVYVGDWDWWQIVSQEEIEIGEGLWDDAEQRAFRIAGGKIDDPESWVAPVTAVAARHEAIRVGDYAVCAEGIGTDITFVRLG